MMRVANGYLLSISNVLRVMGKQFLSDLDYMSWPVLILAIIENIVSRFIEIDPDLSLYCYIGFLLLLILKVIIYKVTCKNHPIISWEEMVKCISLVLFTILLVLAWGIIFLMNPIRYPVYWISGLSLITVSAFVSMHQILTLAIYDGMHGSQKKCYKYSIYFLLCILAAITSYFVMTFPYPYFLLDKISELWLS